MLGSFCFIPTWDVFEQRLKDVSVKIKVRHINVLKTKKVLKMGGYFAFLSYLISNNEKVLKRKLLNFLLEDDIYGRTNNYRR